MPCYRLNIFKYLTKWQAPLFVGKTVYKSLPYWQLNVNFIRYVIHAKSDEYFNYKNAALFLFFLANQNIDLVANDCLMYDSSWVAS